MTTPSSPPIGMKNVATELGISSVNLSLSDSRVRALAGIASGPISLHDLLGKSAYTPMSPTVSVTPDAQEDSNENASFFPFVVPNGGAAPYSYQWYWVGTFGSGGSANFTGSTTNSSVQVDIHITTPWATFGAAVYCAVSDSHGNTVNSNTVSMTYTSP